MSQTIGKISLYVHSEGLVETEIRQIDASLSASCDGRLANRKNVIGVGSIDTALMWLFF